MVKKAMHCFVQLVTGVISPAFHDGHVFVGDALSEGRPTPRLQRECETWVHEYAIIIMSGLREDALRLHSVLQGDPWDRRNLTKIWEPRSQTYAKHLWDTETCVNLEIILCMILWQEKRVSGN